MGRGVRAALHAPAAKDTTRRSGGDAGNPPAPSKPAPPAARTHRVSCLRVHLAQVANHPNRFSWLRWAEARGSLALMAPRRRRRGGGGRPGPRGCSGGPGPRRVSRDAEGRNARQRLGAGGWAAPHSPRASLARRGHRPARVSRGNAPTFAPRRRVCRPRRRGRAAHPSRESASSAPQRPPAAPPACSLARLLGVPLQTFFICLLIGCYSSE